MHTHTFTHTAEHSLTKPVKTQNKRSKIILPNQSRIQCVGAAVASKQSSLPLSSLWPGLLSEWPQHRLPEDTGWPGLLSEWPQHRAPEDTQLDHVFF